MAVLLLMAPLAGAYRQREKTGNV